MTLNQEQVAAFARRYQYLYCAEYDVAQPPPLAEVVARINRLAAKLPESEAEAWDKELHIYAYPDDGFAELRASFSLADTIRADGEGGLVV